MSQAIQTKEVIRDCLFDFFDRLETELKNQFDFVRVAKGKEVVAYFTPKSHENDLSEKSLPNLYVAIRTYTKEGCRTVGPRVEIGTRDNHRYGKLFEKSGQKWSIYNSSEVRDLEGTETTLVLDSDFRMTLYKPGNFDGYESPESVNLKGKVLEAVIELKRLCLLFA